MTYYYKIILRLDDAYKILKQLERIGDIRFTWLTCQRGTSVIIIPESSIDRLPTDDNGFYLPVSEESGHSMFVLDDYAVDELNDLGFNISKDDFV